MDGRGAREFGDVFDLVENDHRKRAARQRLDSTHPGAEIQGRERETGRTTVVGWEQGTKLGGWRRSHRLTQQLTLGACRTSYYSLGLSFSFTHNNYLQQTFRYVVILYMCISYVRSSQ